LVRPGHPVRERFGPNTLSGQLQKKMEMILAFKIIVVIVIVVAIVIVVGEKCTVCG